jgi:hypothetical protein
MSMRYSITVAVDRKPALVLRFAGRPLWGSIDDLSLGVRKSGKSVLDPAHV